MALLQFLQLMEPTNFFSNRFKEEEIKDALQ
jgi:hypothetical protein